MEACSHKHHCIDEAFVFNLQNDTYLLAILAISTGQQFTSAKLKEVAAGINERMVHKSLLYVYEFII